MKIAVLSTIVPNTLRTGSEIATHAMLLGLQSLGHAVTVYAYGRPFLPLVSAVPSVVLATIPITTAEAPALHKLRWVARSLRSGLPISSEKFNYVPPEAIGRAIRSEGADLVLVDHVNLYPFARDWVGDTPLGVVFHDIQALSYAMVAARAARPWWRAAYRRDARLNATIEREAGERAAFSWFLSAADLAVARERFGNPRGLVLPLYYPFGPVPFDPAPVHAAPAYDVGLIGTWTWPPVAQGMAWFLGAVVPRLPRDFSIAAAGLGSEGLPGDRLIRLGLMPDARRFLASCRVSAVPTVAGTGIQIKTLELAATGQPAVATPLGVRGLDDLPPSITVADDADAFAAAIVRRVTAERAAHGSAGTDGIAWNAARRAAAIAIMAETLAPLEKSPAIS